jgi:hypothetical protein
MHHPFHLQPSAIMHDDPCPHLSQHRHASIPPSPCLAPSSYIIMHHSFPPTAQHPRHASIPPSCSIPALLQPSTGIVHHSAPHIAWHHRHSSFSASFPPSYSLSHRFFPLVPASYIVHGLIQSGTHVMQCPSAIHHSRLHRQRHASSCIIPQCWQGRW